MPPTCRTVLRLGTGVGRPVLHVPTPGFRRIPARPGSLPRRGDQPGEARRRPRPVLPAHRRQPAAGVRRLGRAAGKRLAGARPHVPGQPHRPVRVAHRGAQRIHPRPGRSAVFRPAARPAPARRAAGASTRCRHRTRRPRSVGKRAEASFGQGALAATSCAVWIRRSGRGPCDGGAPAACQRPAMPPAGSVAAPARSR